MIRKWFVAGSIFLTGILNNLTSPAQEPRKLNNQEVREFAPNAAPLGRKKSAVGQLSDFPLPRLKKDENLLPNFPWFNIKYLHRNYQENSGKSTGLNASEAITLSQELTATWNYYLELPCLRTDSITAARIYQDPNTVEGALIKYANDHPEIPAATIIFHLQMNGAHLGYDRRNFIKSQDLDKKYYLCDASGQPIIYKGKKWLSPLMPLDIVEKDAAVTRMYLRQLLKHLKRPLNFINENGEVFGHMRPDELLKADPKVAADMARRNLSNSIYNGLFQNRLDSCYKAQILSEPGLKNTLFSFYNVSSVQSGYWPDYFVRKNTNSKINGKYYSTPSFYVTTPGAWAVGKGPSNGYGIIADGREREIAAGIKTFSPFVSAGWGKEEANVRPAQWLGLLKAMTILGAEFFYTGYFNVTGRSGWANGRGPNDPWDYTYQIAMPVYAQAISQHFRKFIYEGDLLKGSSQKRMSLFRLDTKEANHLVMARKIGKTFLIYGTVQPVLNGKGSYPLVAAATVYIEGKPIRLNIRRQGSTYILDLNSPDPVLIQLDGWHEESHPSYWSKNCRIESETGQMQQNCKIMTEGAAVKQLDFTDFVSYVRISNNGNFTIDYPGRRGEVRPISIRVRKAGSGDATVFLQGQGGKRISKVIIDRNWTVINLSKEEVESLNLEKDQSLTMSSNGKMLDIDWIQF